MVNLSSVCRHWRHAALATPKLWSAIYIRNRRTDPQHALAKTWLQRSGGWPLVLTWNGKKDGINQQTLDMLVPYSHRWQSVKLINASAKAAQDIFSEKTFPCIQSRLKTRTSQLYEQTMSNLPIGFECSARHMISSPVPGFLGPG